MAPDNVEHGVPLGSFDIETLADMIGSSPAFSMQGFEAMKSPIISRVDIRESPVVEQMRESAEYQKKSYEVLRAIERNTAGLPEIIELIYQSTQNQDEIIELLNEIHTIAKAKTKEEAGSLYTKAFEKMGKVVKDAETLQKMVSYAGMIFGFVTSCIQNGGVG